MTLDYGAVGALLGAGTGIAAVFMFCTRAIVREEISKLNGTYLRKEVAEQRFRAIDEHFELIKGRSR